MIGVCVWLELGREEAGHGSVGTWNYLRQLWEHTTSRGLRRNGTLVDLLTNQSYELDWFPGISLYF